MARLDELLSYLTLEEKAGMLSGKDYWSTLDVSRLGIKGIVMSDGPHGLRKLADTSVNDGEANKATCFPPLGTIANSFNKELMFKMGEAIGEECVSEGIHILLGPSVNIKRTPLGGRNFEYISEDPFLSGELASEYVKGVQSKGVGACVKHFAVNSQETYRYSSSSLVDLRALNEIYLEPFRKVVQEANPVAVMTAYNRVNGSYCSENTYLLDTLRQSWGFDGLVISDWGGTNNRIKSLMAGLDLEMPSSHSVNDKEIIDAVNAKSLDVKYVDDSVKRILSASNKLVETKQVKCDLEAHNDLAYEIAKESFVLLKNEDNILPLNRNEKIIVVGQLAEYPNIQGEGSSKVNNNYLVSPLELLKRRYKNETLLEYCRGYSESKEDEIALKAAAINAARSGNKVILFMGSNTDKEGVDRESIKLPNNQLELLKAIYSVNKNIVIVLSGGSVIDLSFDTMGKALLHTFLMGQNGSKALVETLFGEINPSGKLTETIPNRLEDNPTYKFFPGGRRHNYYVESIYVGYRYYDTYRLPVKYPFGYGLSYTTFRTLPMRSAITDKEIIIRCSIKNVGQYKGSEVIQVYVRNKSKKDYYAYQELKGFRKVELDVNETKEISITIPLKELKYFDVEDNKFEVESGDYEVILATSSRTPIQTYPIHIKGSKDNKTIHNENTCYYKHIPFNLNDFKYICKLNILPDIDEVIKPYDGNVTLGEIKNTAVGKTLYALVNKGIQKTTTLNQKELKQMLDYLPLRMLAIFGGNEFTFNQLDGVIDILNGKLIRGSKKLKNKETINLNGKK